MQRMQCMDGMDMITMGTVCEWSSLEVVGELEGEVAVVEVEEPQEADMVHHPGVRSIEW